MIAAVASETQLFGALATLVSFLAVGVIRHVQTMDLSDQSVLSRINIGFIWPGSAVVVALFGWSRALSLGVDDVGLGTYVIGTAYVAVIWMATRRGAIG